MLGYACVHGCIYGRMRVHACMHACMNVGMFSYCFDAAMHVDLVKSGGCKASSGSKLLQDSMEVARQKSKKLSVM